MITEKNNKRGFGGKIDNFKDKQERAFEKRHLKAYLKGHERFRMGFIANGEPAWYFVMYKSEETADNTQAITVNP